MQAQGAAKPARRPTRTLVVPRREQALAAPARRSSRVAAAARTRNRSATPPRAVRDDSPLTPLPDTPPPDIALSVAALQRRNRMETPPRTLRESSPFSSLPPTPPPRVKVDVDPRPFVTFDPIEPAPVRVKTEDDA